jgi:GNAT superfamily N-acetyltransferase
MDDIRTIQLIPGPAFSWESQAVQYEVTGVPGRSLEYHWVDLDSGEEVFPPNPQDGPDIAGATRIDCLLHRGEDGLLDGILNHYDGKNPIEGKDSINVWVRADRQRQGIGRGLVHHAITLWPGVTYDKQRYTLDGVELLRDLIQRGGV